MARDRRGTRRTAPRPRHGFFLRASRSLPHPRGNPPAAAKAWEAFVLVRTPPASLRAPPSTAKRPKSATVPARICRSIVHGRRREGTALLPAGELPEWVSPSPAAPTILRAKGAPSVILHNRGHQPRREVPRHAVQRRVLLFKKILDAVRVVHVRGNLVLIAENKIVRVGVDFSVRALFKVDLLLRCDQHDLSARRGHIIE